MTLTTKNFSIWTSASEDPRHQTLRPLVPQSDVTVEVDVVEPDAVAWLAYDADLSGLIVLPTLTLHALHDPTVSFGVEAIYARTVAEAGRGDLLVQAATNESEHSKLADAEYLTMLNALAGWIRGEPRPDPARFQALCLALSAPPDQCRFVAPPFPSGAP